MDALRLLLNEVEAEEEFFSSTEIELTCKCDDKIRKASSTEEMLSYAVFKCVDDLSVFINNYLASFEVPANVADDGDEFTKRISEMVVDDVIRSVTRLESIRGIKAGGEISSSEYIAECSVVFDQCALSDLNLDTLKCDPHLSTCEDHVINPALLVSDSNIPKLKYRATSCKTSRHKKRHLDVLEDPSWASRLKRGVRFDDKGRVVAIADAICPRQRMDAAIKVAWNIQTNKPETKYN